MPGARHRREWTAEETARFMDLMSVDCRRETERFVLAMLERYRESGVPDVASKAVLGEALVAVGGRLVGQVKDAALAAVPAAGRS